MKSSVGEPPEEKKALGCVDEAANPAPKNGRRRLAEKNIQSRFGDIEFPYPG
jgi:hypothetical protein